MHARPSLRAHLCACSFNFARPSLRVLLHLCAPIFARARTTLLAHLCSCSHNFARSSLRCSHSFARGSCAEVLLILENQSIYSLAQKGPPLTGPFLGQNRYFGFAVREFVYHFVCRFLYARHALALGLQDTGYAILEWKRCENARSFSYR